MKFHYWKKWMNIRNDWTEIGELHIQRVIRGLQLWDVIVTSLIRLTCSAKLLVKMGSFNCLSAWQRGKYVLNICQLYFYLMFANLFIREQLLHSMLRPMSEARSTADMYEESSFLRNRTLLNFLVHILEPLCEFHIVLEKSLTHGISSIC